MNDGNGHATAVTRPDHRQGLIGEHRRREGHGEDQHGNHYAGDHPPHVRVTDISRAAGRRRRDRTVPTRWRQSPRPTGSDAWTGSAGRACTWARRGPGHLQSTIVGTRTPRSVDADGPAVPVRELEPGRPLTRTVTGEAPPPRLPDGEQDRCRHDQGSPGEPGGESSAPLPRAGECPRDQSACEQADAGE